ncbi:type IX secretion system membrane protein PorP/SprF [Parasediminibacterium sp. JCM 36343]|uniref:PorP/SprF family type IX secretion system membrane protein n=1 Tax=Parasediminibacterium sp. JCM 36343 TaxID=3374279 RepID=UPI0039786B4A
MKQKILITFFIILCIKQAQAQQDIQFSQYVFNGLSVNPAYAGYKEDLYFNAVYRKQWVSFPGAPQSGAVSMDGLLKGDSKKSGLGGQIAWDQLGPQKTISLFASYAYRIQLDNDDTKRLSIGLAFGANQYSLDGNALVATDQGDPSIPTGTLSAIKPDARMGVYYYTPKLFAGLAFMDLFSLYADRSIYLSNGTLVATEKKAAHMYLSFGGLVKLSDNVKLKPSLLVKEDFHGPTSIDLNLLALLSEKLWVGASYRTAADLWKKEAVNPGLSKSGAVSLMMEFFATENLRVGYSYDFITSGLSNYQSGSHEISLGLLFPGKKDASRIKSPRYF